MATSREAPVGSTQEAPVNKAATASCVQLALGKVGPRGVWMHVRVAPRGRR